jgi:hypothetical protein
LLDIFEQFVERGGPEVEEGIEIVDNWFDLIFVRVAEGLFLFFIEERKLSLVIVEVRVVVEVANGKQGVEEVMIAIVFHLQVHHILLL